MRKIFVVLFVLALIPAALDSQSYRNHDAGCNSTDAAFGVKIDFAAAITCVTVHSDANGPALVYRYKDGTLVDDTAIRVPVGEAIEIPAGSPDSLYVDKDTGSDWVCWLLLAP